MHVSSILTVCYNNLYNYSIIFYRRSLVLYYKVIISFSTHPLQATTDSANPQASIVKVKTKQINASAEPIATGQCV